MSTMRERLRKFFDLVPAGELASNFGEKDLVAFAESEVSLALKETLINELHRRSGICGHCGSKKCAAKASWSNLPAKLSTDDVLAAMDAITAKLADKEAK